MWCHIQHNAVFVQVLRVQLFIVVIFLFKAKKRLRVPEGVRILSKIHIIKKMAAPKFLFWRSELILCNIFLPFFHFGKQAFTDPRQVGRGRCILSLFFFLRCGISSIPHLTVLFIHPVVVLQNEGPFSCGCNKRTIHLSSDCSHREKPGL